MAKILIVDDEAALLKVYAEELSAEGHEVVSARDGKEALKLLSAEKPQLVIMDIRMPQMDGVETLVAMLGKNRTIPVILHTAHPEYRENYMTWGAEAFVLKSSDLGPLKKKVREILQRNR